MLCVRLFSERSMKRYLAQIRLTSLIFVRTTDSRISAAPIRGQSAKGERGWLIVGDMRNKGLSKKQRKHYTVLMGQIKTILSVMIVQQTLSPCIKNKPEKIRYATQYRCKVFPNNEFDLTS